MRTLAFLLFGLLLSDGLWGQKLPAVEIKNLQGKNVNTSMFTNQGKPMVISFWATWCKPCVKELTAINENYPDWQKATGIKVIAISTDDSRSQSRVGPFVASKGWTFEVYCDPNGDFKRAMNVANVPHTFLLDGNGNIVYQHTSYVDGDEEILYQKILELSK